ncbi:hypothetical protein [Methylobacterium sp. V23]|uniref:hypothetical protein n=1 Tax=Methylobacterium sp. V23 TaxID=2044878 RepID=UPI0015E16986|nr:hypothetical protein [Methylobacterium sp. V23]
MTDLLSPLAASARRSRLPEVLHGAINIELRCLDFGKREWADLWLAPLDHLLLRLKLGRFSVSDSQPPKSVDFQVLQTSWHGQHLLSKVPGLLPPRLTAGVIGREGCLHQMGKETTDQGSRSTRSRFDHGVWAPV